MFSKNKKNLSLSSIDWDKNKTDDLNNTYNNKIIVGISFSYIKSFNDELYYSIDAVNSAKSIILFNNYVDTNYIYNIFNNPSIKYIKLYSAFGKYIKEYSSAILENIAFSLYRIDSFNYGYVNLTRIAWIKPKNSDVEFYTNLYKKLLMCK